MSVTSKINEQIIAAAVELTIVIEQVGQEIDTNVVEVIAELEMIIEKESATEDQIASVFRKLDMVLSHLAALKEKLDDGGRISELIAAIEKERYNLVYLIESVKDKTGVRTKKNDLEFAFE